MKSRTLLWLIISILMARIVFATELESHPPVRLIISAGTFGLIVAAGVLQRLELGKEKL